MPSAFLISRSRVPAFPRLPIPRSPFLFLPSRELFAPDGVYFKHTIPEQRLKCENPFSLRLYWPQPQLQL